MRYQMHGADRESGKPSERMIEATDESDARAQASSLGLMVETFAVVADADADETKGRYTVRVLSTSVDNGQEGASTIRSRLEGLLNSLAVEGWEFVSVQSVPAITLAGHHGRGRITADNVAADVCLAVFRRERQQAPQARTRADVGKQPAPK
jgi:hypothetical protein